MTGNWSPIELSLANAITAEANIKVENIYGKPDDKISLPLYMDGRSSMTAMSFVLEYNSQVLKALGASVTSLTEDYLIASNIEEGHIKIAMAGTQPINSPGAVVNLEFKVLDTELSDARSHLKITEIVINDGNIEPNIQAAEFMIGTPVLLEYALHQNHPNPFNPSTVVSYQLSEAAHVSLTVYDVLGREIATLVDEYKQPGLYNSQFSILNYQLPSGVYFYQLKAGRFFQSKKMMVVK